MNKESCRAKKNWDSEWEKPLGKSIFPVFLTKNNFITKIDIDLIFFLKVEYKLGAIIKIYKRKKQFKKKAMCRLCKKKERHLLLIIS